MPRRKAFDPDHALDRAMELFWQRGYDGASMSDLLEHMGISRQSLYDTFGDKPQLFQQALDRYARRNVSAMLYELEQPDAGADALRAFFRRLPDILLSFPERRACLMVNTMVDRGPTADTTDVVAAHRMRLIRAFRAALFQASRQGLRLPMPPATLAAALVAQAMGITVASRAGAPEAELREMARAALVLAGVPD
ncbi:MAG: TetR/AcrR family transcriptional regulator [Myxococcota bacterium]